MPQAVSLASSTAAIPVILTQPLVPTDAPAPVASPEQESGLEAAHEEMPEPEAEFEEGVASGEMHEPEAEAAFEEETLISAEPEVEPEPVFDAGPEDDAEVEEISEVAAEVVVAAEPESESEAEAPVTPAPAAQVPGPADFSEKLARIRAAVAQSAAAPAVGATVAGAGLVGREALAAKAAADHAEAESREEADPVMGAEVAPDEQDDQLPDLQDIPAQTPLALAQDDLIEGDQDGHDSVLAAHFDRADEAEDEDDLYDAELDEVEELDAQLSSEDDDFAADDAASEPEVAQEAEEPAQSAEMLRAQIRGILGSTGLKAQDETALLDELAEIEQEVAPRRQRHAARATMLRDAPEADAERLMAIANSELGERDSQRRREAFEHMRVAVDATRAEEEATGPRRVDIEEQREINRYRKDMETPDLITSSRVKSEDRPVPEAPEAIEPVSEDVMPAREEIAEEQVAEEPVVAQIEQELPRPVPRRPAAIGSARRERPQTERAPLVLVSEQRVDAPQSSGPVRPRRVRIDALSGVDYLTKSSDAPLSPEDLDSFRSFAQEVDAWLLDEQIEAAAAYVTHRKSQQEFTRIELMNYVMANNEGNNVPRDDMLRGFGVLLREGRLERGSNGLFRLSKLSEFDEPARKYAAN
jgi:hypothetical protein